MVDIKFWKREREKMAVFSWTSHDWSFDDKVFCSMTANEISTRLSPEPTGQGVPWALALREGCKAKPLSLLNLTTQRAENSSFSSAEGS